MAYVLRKHTNHYEMTDIFGTPIEVGQFITFAVHTQKRSRPHDAVLCVAYVHSVDRNTFQRSGFRYALRTCMLHQVETDEVKFIGERLMQKMQIVCGNPSVFRGPMDVMVMNQDLVPPQYVAAVKKADNWVGF